MFIDKFDFSKIDYAECAMYLGVPFEKSADFLGLFDRARAELIEIAEPKVVYEILFIDGGTNQVSFKGTDLVLKGSSICEHLEGMNSAVFLCATMGIKVDKLIKEAQLSSMEYALVLDAMAGAMIESVCDQVEVSIREKYNPSEMNFRFGLGYGDLPLEQMPDFLDVLNARKLIGVNVSSANMLIPTKSVACILGLKL